MNYYPSSCGLLGVMRKANSEKIPGIDVNKSLDSIRYRGSDKGSGYAVFNLGDNNYKLKVFYDGNIEELNNILENRNVKFKDFYSDCNDGIPSYCYDLAVENTEFIDQINSELWNSKKGRIYSSGTSLNVFKGIGYPDDVARDYGIDNMSGDLWLGHTRQPTNSPGDMPYWSHPFSTFNIAIVHNGDISSFGTNREFLKSEGIKSFVGTDSEVISFIFKELMKKYDLITAIKIMADRIDDPYIRYINRGFVLDGPYTVVIGYDSGDDLYLIAIADRTKLRPVILGEDKLNYYVASEEKEIRLMGKNPSIWSLEPGNYFIASLKKGIISYGREIRNEIYNKKPENFDLDAADINYKELDKYIINTGKKKVRIKGVSGHKYIGMKFSSENYHLKLYGNAGNCLMNLNANNNVDVYGNVSDDCCDSMSGGIIKIYGNAGDVLGQALTAGKIYIKGNTGNRTGIQMRAYGDENPVIVIGGGFDDYLGEYMSGGTILVLGDKNCHYGKYIASGMIGGKIYIHGKVDPESAGLQPDKDEMENILKAVKSYGAIDSDIYNKLSGRPAITVLDSLSGSDKILSRLTKMHEIPQFNYRFLNNEERISLGNIIKDYDIKMGENHNNMIMDRFTVIEKRM